MVAACAARLALIACAAVMCHAAAPPGFVTNQLLSGLDNSVGNAVTKTRHLPDGRVLLALRRGQFLISQSTVPLHPTLLFAIKPARFYLDGEIG